MMTPLQHQALALWQWLDRIMPHQSRKFIELVHGKVPYFKQASDEECSQVIQEFSPGGHLIANLKATGKVTGHCQVCGRELTNDESVKLGIGPICAGRLDSQIKAHLQGQEVKQ